MNKYQQIRWGILGCGDVTEKKSGPAFANIPHSSISAVMRRDAAKAADYARRHHIPAHYSDAQQLIDDPVVDAVYIATPPGSHCNYALRVAAAGKPCYVEKPMARTHDECQQMIAAFAAANTPLFIAYYRRSLPRFHKVRDLLAENAIGDLIAIEYSYADNQCSTALTPTPWRFLPEHSGGGLLLDLGSHLLDLLDFLLGPLTLTFSDAKRFGAYPVEDYVVLNFTIPSGVRGVAEWDFTSDTREDKLLLEGTRGKIEIPCFATTPILLETPAGAQHFDIPNPENIQQPHIQSIVNQLLAVPNITCPGTPESATRTQKIMEDAIRPFYKSPA